MSVRARHACSSAIIHGNLTWLHEMRRAISMETTPQAVNTQPRVPRLRVRGRYWSSSMHRSYQPLKPVTNRYLQQQWDQDNYDNHRRKVNSALPLVDTKGMRTPAHIQLKLKKLQLHDERLSIITRDNRLLASKLADIVGSKGLVDHWNQYHLRSLNADRRREELMLISRQNQAIYQRITSRQSQYRRQLWMDDWERAERRQEAISRYPRGLGEKQRSHRKVKFAAMEYGERSTSCSNTSTDRT